MQNLKFSGWQEEYTAVESPRQRRIFTCWQPPRPDHHVLADSEDLGEK